MIEILKDIMQPDRPKEFNEHGVALYVCDGCGSLTPDKSICEDCMLEEIIGDANKTEKVVEC